MGTYVCRADIDMHAEPGGPPLGSLLGELHLPRGSRLKFRIWSCWGLEAHGT